MVSNRKLNDILTSLSKDERRPNLSYIFSAVANKRCRHVYACDWQLSKRPHKVVMSKTMPARIARRCESANRLCGEVGRIRECADCSWRRAAVSFHYWLCRDNATRLSGNDWLWLPNRA